jgi:hypothetical protein
MSGVSVDTNEPKELRFGDYVRDVQANYTQISYNDLTRQTAALKTKSIVLRPLDVYRLVTPYVSVRFLEQVYGLVP